MLVDRCKQDFLFAVDSNNNRPSCLRGLFTLDLDNASPKDLQDILCELDVMKSLQPHPYVVGLIGCCIEKGTGLLISVCWLLYFYCKGYR